MISVVFPAHLSGPLQIFTFILLSAFFPEFSSDQFWYIPKVSYLAHLLFFVKSLIVAGSWLFAYFALKHLPITVVTPIRASSPVWVLLGAILLYGEKLSPLQWSGLAVTLAFYYLFSLAGKKEGIEFRRNKWIYFIIAATLLGSISSLYDKYLTANYDRLAMQAYFSVYLVAALFPVAAFLWYPKRHNYTPFKWRIVIPLIGVALVVADFIYFYALSIPGSLISVVAAIRRGSVITSFLLGAIVFHKEKNKKLKGLILIGILAGIVMMMLGS